MKLLYQTVKFYPGTVFPTHAPPQDVGIRTTHATIMNADLNHILLIDHHPESFLE